MQTLWGYPMKLVVDVHGEEVNVTNAVVEVNPEKALTIISEHEARRVTRPSLQRPFDQELDNE